LPLGERVATGQKNSLSSDSCHKHAGERMNEVAKVGFTYRHKISIAAISLLGFKYSITMPLSYVQSINMFVRKPLPLGAPGILDLGML
jgi:hypothetical protein